MQLIFLDKKLRNRPRAQPCEQQARAHCHKQQGAPARMAAQQGAGSVDSLGDLLEILIKRIAVAAIGHGMQ